MTKELKLFLVTGYTHQRGWNRFLNFGDNNPEPISYRQFVVVGSSDEAIANEIGKINAKEQQWNARVEELKAEVESGKLTPVQARYRIDPLGLGPSFMSPQQVLDPERWNAVEVDVEGYEIIIRPKQS